MVNTVWVRPGIWDPQVLRSLRACHPQARVPQLLYTPPESGAPAHLDAKIVVFQLYPQGCAKQRTWLYRKRAAAAGAGPFPGSPWRGGEGPCFPTVARAGVARPRGRTKPALAGSGGATAAPREGWTPSCGAGLLSCGHGARQKVMPFHVSITNGVHRSQNWTRIAPSESARCCASFHGTPDLYGTNLEGLWKGKGGEEEVKSKG